MSENETLTPTEAVITLYQPLGPDGADGHALARRIWDLEAGGCRVLHLRINSTGGSVVHGYSLFSALRHTRMEVHTWLDGLALSMAGLIFLAGHERHMAPWGLLMLHNPGLDPGEESPAEEEGSRELLGRIRASLLEMYASCTAVAPQALSEMMDAQTWLTASRCLHLGLAAHASGQPFPEVEQQLDRMAASHPVASLEPAALQALAASVQGYANGSSPIPLAAPAVLPALAVCGPVPGPASFRELERTDPARLAALRRRDPEGFQALYDRCYRW